uniref:Uncharacterized protein n=1 Tax=viral metagenome TaxID=1070528 RepID=A0A6M3K6E1_9ZZZZ
MFKFIDCRYKLHQNLDQYERGWFLYLDDKDSFEKFINKRGYELVRAYMNLKVNVSKDNPFRYKNGGHISNVDESTIANILYLDDTRKTTADDCKHLDKLLSGYRMLFISKGHVLVNHNNGCRYMDDSFQILETRISKEIIFPTCSEKDITVKQWEGGKHWYVRVGNYDLSDKYNTYQSGFEAGKKYLSTK